MNIKEILAQSIKDAAQRAIEAGTVKAGELPTVVLEVPPQKEFGDFATNFAMQAARSLKCNPRMVAQAVADNLNCAYIDKTEIAGPGFINFYLKQDWIYSLLSNILAQGDAYGNLQQENPEKLQLEYVSANPTGPLHVGHGRGAAVGSALSNLMKSAGYDVTREYYINDAGNQIENLAASVNARYLALMGVECEFPENGYHGVDIIDTAMSPFAMGTSQPATEVMVETFKGTPYDTGLDQNKLAEIADYFRPMRDEALDTGLLNPKNLGVNIKTLLYQVPGGMLSNLTSQLKEQHAEDKYYDVLEEVPRVRKDLGECPLVTPSSQIVGTQAVFNVLMGERYKMVTKETKDVLAGKYGATVKPFNPEVQKKCIGDTEPITCRYADLLEPELPKLEKEIEQWKQQDEDVLTYALFPQVAVDFFKYREAQQTKVDPAAADKKDGAYPV